MAPAGGFSLGPHGVFTLSHWAPTGLALSSPFPLLWWPALVCRQPLSWFRAHLHLTWTGGGQEMELAWSLVLSPAGQPHSLSRGCTPGLCGQPLSWVQGRKVRQKPCWACFLLSSLTHPPIPWTMQEEGQSREHLPRTLVWVLEKSRSPGPARGQLFLDDMLLLLDTSLIISPRGWIGAWSLRTGTSATQVPVLRSWEIKGERLEFSKSFLYVSCLALMSPAKLDSQFLFILCPEKERLHWNIIKGEKVEYVGLIFTVVLSLIFKYIWNACAYLRM